MGDSFRLHPRLVQDTIELGRFDLCRVLLMNDSRFPWCILVPERPDIAEIHQLSDADQVTLIRESSFLAERMAHAFEADKMNVAVLGNIVPQLHVHHIARYEGDAVWPAPVWGNGTVDPYDERGQEETRARLTQLLHDRLARD